MNILRRFTNINDKINVATFSTHERYHSHMAHCDANFYLLQGQGIKPWCDLYNPLPKNHVLLQPEHSIPDYIDVDVVLSQNKSAHYNKSIQICKKYQVPLICLEHCLPPPNISNEDLTNYQNARGDINVFISAFSRDAWGFNDKNSYVVEHGINTDLFTKIEQDNNTPYILSVANDYINRDWCLNFRLWQDVTGHGRQPNFQYKILGNTPGLSEAAKDVPTLIQEYNQAGIFFNTSKISPIPTTVLEAMSCGCAVVSTNTCMIPNVIKHEYNGLLSNDPAQLRNYCKMLINDKDMRTELGNNARKTILEHYNLQRFVNNWNIILNLVKS